MAIITAQVTGLAQLKSRPDDVFAKQVPQDVIHAVARKCFEQTILNRRCVVDVHTGKVEPLFDANSIDGTVVNKPLALGDGNL